MKRLSFFLYIMLILLPMLHAKEYGHILHRDNDPSTPSTGYPGGSTFTSLNGKFQLMMQNDGYLVLSELTSYGRIKRWQFPQDGDGTPGNVVQLFTHYAGTNEAIIFYVGKNNGPFGDLTVRYIYDSYPASGPAGWVDIRNDGNLNLYHEDGRLIWQSHTTDADVYGKPNYHACASQGINLYFPRAFKDEHNTVYYATGNIVLADQCKITQAIAPVKFEAKGTVEMLPGFETNVSGNGSIIMKPIATAGTPAARQQQTEDKELKPRISDFSLFPNPATNMVTIKLPPGEEVKQILVFDNNGKLVLQLKNTFYFDVGKLSDGIYLYRIETSAHIYTGKMAKQ